MNGRGIAAATAAARISVVSVTAAATAADEEEVDSNVFFGVNVPLVRNLIR